MTEESPNFAELAIRHIVRLSPVEISSILEKSIIKIKPLSNTATVLLSGCDREALMNFLPDLRRSIKTCTNARTLKIGLIEGRSRALESDLKDIEPYSDAEIEERLTLSMPE